MLEGHVELLVTPSPKVVTHTPSLVAKRKGGSNPSQASLSKKELQMKNPSISLTDEELELLKTTKNAVEWDATCDLIKGARGGVYPHDWFARVNQSGLMSEVRQSWQ
jgi:hypothetical protein